MIALTSSLIDHLDFDADLPHFVVVDLKRKQGHDSNVQTVFLSVE